LLPIIDFYEKSEKYDQVMRPILLAFDPEIIYQCLMEKEMHFFSINKQPAMDRFKSMAGCV